MRRAWSRAALEASFERDDDLRRERPARPSSSEPLHRCATCKQWARADAFGQCLVCHDRYQGVPNRGMDRGGVIKVTLR